MGNIEADAIVFVADLLMARALRARNCLLWYTSSGKPDLGGKEQDDFRYARLSERRVGLDGSGPGFGRERVLAEGLTGPAGTCTMHCFFSARSKLRIPR